MCGAFPIVTGLIKKYGGNKAFVERFTCLSLPLSIRFFVFAYLIVMPILTFGHSYNIYVNNAVATHSKEVLNYFVGMYPLLINILYYRRLGKKFSKLK